MNLRAVRLTTMFVFALLSVVHAQDVSTKPAQTAAESWLSLVDTGNYGGSWDEAAAFFKAAIAREKWEGAVKTARTPFGELKTRTLKSATAASTLPGAPDGEYVVFQYNTTFAQKQAATETVTMMKQSDGTWRSAGYFVR